MDEILADLIYQDTREGLESARARGQVGSRKPKLTARQAEVARGMYKEKGADGRRKYTAAEIAETFGVSRKTVYRHIEPSGGRRRPGKTTPLLRDPRHEHPPLPVVNTAAAAPSRQPATGS
jgi:DNA invertase Pin-like site-specific DNA recombinase